MRLDKVDMVRSGAGLAVLLGHLGAFLFVEHSAVPTRSLLTDAFFELTGFGHQAAVVFVLSDF